MPCEDVRQLLLHLDLDELGRQRVTAALKHLDECQSCREAFADFDAMRNAVALPEGEVEPIGGSTSFQKNLITSASPARPSWHWLPMLAIAATVLAVAAAFEIGRLAARQVERLPMVVTGQPAPSDEHDAHFTPAHITHEVNAFHQVSQVLDGRAGWMLMSDKASDVGVADTDINSTGKVLLFHLTVSARGKELSGADLLVIPGQTAKLTVPMEGDKVLHYRIGTSVDEPTHLTLMLELRSPGGSEPLAALSTDLRMEPGQKVTAGELCSYSDRYMVKVGFARASLSSEGRQ